MQSCFIFKICFHYSDFSSCRLHNLLLYCNRRMNKFFKFFLAEVRRECACMSSYLALQIPHQKVISFKITFQPERVVHTPVNRNLLFTKICWYYSFKMLRYRYLLAVCFQIFSVLLRVIDACENWNVLNEIIFGIF